MNRKSRYSPTNRDLLIGLNQKVMDLHVRLYGEEHDTGDIPAIRNDIKEHRRRIGRLEKAVIAIVVAGGGGTGVWALIERLV